MNTNTEDTEIVVVKDDAGKKVGKRVPRRHIVKFEQPTNYSGRYGRVACAGGCGRSVIAKIGECRKCRRRRVLEGKRVIYKAEKQTNK